VDERITSRPFPMASAATEMSSPPSAPKSRSKRVLISYSRKNKNADASPGVSGGSARQLSFMRKKAEAPAEEEVFDEELERRKSRSAVDEAASQEQQRLVDEAIIEEQRAKLQREESRRIAAAQASEEQKRRLSEAKETEEKMIQLEKAASMEQQMLAKSLAEAEQARRVEEAKAEEEAAEQARLSQRMQVVEDMERERERRIAEDPQSPGMLMRLQENRRASQRDAIDAMEVERQRQMGVVMEGDKLAHMQRQKSMQAALAAAETERERRLSPTKASRPRAESSGSSGGAFASTIVFLVSVIALLGLLTLTFEDRALGVWGQAKSTACELLPFIAPPPPPPPPVRAKFFGFF